MHKETFSVLEAAVDLRKVDETAFSPFQCASAQVEVAPGKPIPEAIVWMPKGVNEEVARRAKEGFDGSVVCDAEAATRMEESRLEAASRGVRAFIDENHDNNKSAGWIKKFFWDDMKGIMASIEWTPLGIKALTEKLYYSFSPTCMISNSTGRPSKLKPGSSAGGLTNCPAFGAAMPSLIASQKPLESTQTAPAGTAGKQKIDTTMNKAEILALLAKLGVTLPETATDAEINAALVKATAAVKTEKEVSAGDKTAELEARLNTLIAASKASEIDVALEAAIGDGRLPREKKGFFAKQSNVVELIANLPTPQKRDAVFVPFTSRAADVVGSSPEEGFKALKASEANDIPNISVEAEVMRHVGLSASEANRVAVGLRQSKIFNKVFKPVINQNGAYTGTGCTNGFNFRNDMLKSLMAADGDGNTLGTLAGIVVSQQWLYLLKLQLEWLLRCSTNVSAASASILYNQQVLVRTIGIPTPAQYVAGTGYAASAAVDADVPVTLNQHWSVELGFGVEELGATNRDLFGEHVAAGVYGLVKKIADTVLANITTANYTETPTVQALYTSATDFFGRDTLVDAQMALEGRGATQPNKLILLNSAGFGRLSKDPYYRGIAQFQTGKTDAFLGETRIPVTATFQPYHVPNMPASGGNSNIFGVGLAPDAICFASRVPSDYASAQSGAMNGSLGTIIDADTGFALAEARYVSNQLGKSFRGYRAMWGSAPGQQKSAQLFQTAAAS